MIKLKKILEEKVDISDISWNHQKLLKVGSDYIHKTRDGRLWYELDDDIKKSKNRTLIKYFKEYDKAEELFNKGLEIAPNNPLLYLALGQMFDRMKEYDIAINYYETILEFTEDEVEKDFEHMNQYYHKLMDISSYPDSLAKTKEKARKNLKKNYRRIGRETTL